MEQVQKIDLKEQVEILKKENEFLKSILNKISIETSKVINLNNKSTC